MGTFVVLLFLLAVSSVFQSTSGRVTEDQALFTLEKATLSLEPQNNVERDADVTARCRPVVKSSSGTSLVRRYTLLKDGVALYAENISSTEDMVYRVPNVRVRDTGKYKCLVSILDKTTSSNTERLTVTGLSQPVLTLHLRSVLREGDLIHASCEAPGEFGNFIFRFHEDNQEIHEETTTSNQVKTEFRLNNAGSHDLTCDYTIIMVPDSVTSIPSNSSTVFVTVLPFTSVIKISPDPTLSKIFEGDTIQISCTVDGSRSETGGLKVFLSNGVQLLSDGPTAINHNLTVFSNNSGEFECNLKMGDVYKKANSSVKILEIISTPVLTVDQDVFENDPFLVRCTSDVLAPERVAAANVKYDIYRIDDSTSFKGNLFRDLVLSPGSRKYLCQVEAGNVVKRSAELTVRIKALASEPDIWAVGRVVVGRPFQVRCRSDRGTLPIVHALLKNRVAVGRETVRLPDQRALFNLTIQHPEEIHEYSCSSQNSNRTPPVVGRPLNTSVVVPLSDPVLTTLPALDDIAEGEDLYLICSVRGTPPVTFRWYRIDSAASLFNTTSPRSSGSLKISDVDHQHSGTYFCEAVNYANVRVQSQKVTIEVKIATWKKGVIVASCLLLVAVIALLSVLRYRAKRGKREPAAELSVKPSSPKPDDSVTASLTHDTAAFNVPPVGVDTTGTSVRSERSAHPGVEEEISAGSKEPDVEYTEVVHPQHVDPARVPLRKGTDTVYSEVQNSPTDFGDLDHHDYGSVEYAELSTEPPEHNQPEVNHHDLPTPVD